MRRGYVTWHVATCGSFGGGAEGWEGSGGLGGNAEGCGGMGGLRRILEECGGCRSLGTRAEGRGEMGGMRRFRGECGRAWKSGGSEGRGSARAHSACAVSGRHPQAMLSLATTPPRWRDRRWRRGPRLAAAASPAAAGPRGRRPLGAPPPPCRLARARARPVAGASARGRRLRWRRVLGRHGHGNIMARGQFLQMP